MKKLLFFLSIACIAQIHGQIITTIVGNGTQGYSGDNGLATSAVINSPRGPAIDTKGNIYFSQLGFGSSTCTGDGIRKINTLGVITSILGGSAFPCALDEPWGLAFDAHNNLYFGNAFGRVINKMDTSGNVSTIAGNGSFGSSGDGGPAIQAGIGESSNIALDLFGNLYIADGNNRIRKVDTAGIIITIAGNGLNGYGGDGGLATFAKLNGPLGVETDILGNVYIADTENNRIRKVDTAGIITTVAGTGIPGFSGDGGMATSAQINRPADIALDKKGNMFITDYFNDRIRKIDTSGIITTVVGNGTQGYNGDGGAATFAEITTPTRLALDSIGNIYFPDGNRIRKVTHCGSPLSINISGTSNICGGNSTSLTANGATTYTWSSNAGSSNTNTVVVNPSSTTIYTVTGVTGGCINYNTFSVTVNPILSFSGIPMVCVGGGSTVLTGNGASTYTWSNNAGGVTTNSVSLSPTAATTYSLSGETGGCVTTQTITVNISVPIQSILSNSNFMICDSTSAGGYVFSLSTSGTATSFTWMPGNIHTASFIVPNSINGVYTYTVTGTDSLGCLNSDTATVSVMTCVAGITSNSIDNNEIRIYPNPTSDQFYIETNTTDKLKVDLYDANGRHVFSASVSDKSNINVATLDNGIYTMAIKTAARVINKKLVIVH